MKRKPKKRVINQQAQQAAQNAALSRMVDAADDAADHASAQSHCTELLVERLEEIRAAITALFFLNESGELNPQDWYLVTKFFDDLAAVAPQLHFPIKFIDESAA